MHIGPFHLFRILVFKELMASSSRNEKGVTMNKHFNRDVRDAASITAQYHDAFKYSVNARLSLETLAQR